MYAVKRNLEHGHDAAFHQILLDVRLHFGRQNGLHEGLGLGAVLVFIAHNNDVSVRRLATFHN